MKFDRNTVLGFGILAVLLIGYFYVTSKQQAEYRKQKAREQFVQDSISRANKPKMDTLVTRQDSASNDSTNKIVQSGQFKGAVSDKENLFVVQNNLLKITFTSKGGQPKKVELKKYKTTDSSLVTLAGTDFDKISYTINTSSNSSAQTSDLNFELIDSTLNQDGSRTIRYLLSSSDTNAKTSIIHKFTVLPDDYMIDFTMEFTGAAQLLTNGTLNLHWQYAAVQQETDIDFEKQNTQVGYVKNGEFDYHTISRRSSKSFDESVNWVGIRQRFFFTILTAKNKFSSGNMEWVLPPDSTHTIVRSIATMKLNVQPGSKVDIPLSIYYGPSDFHILKNYDLKYEKLVNLGQGMYAFVRPINRYIIMPCFNFLQGFTANMGIVIALLTVFIRLLTSPLIYKSYLSGAKMKALKPEISKLKEKFGDDRQAMSMEQMKLFREAGVNPLGGCIPALLQIPIFFALFTFFNAELSLRGTSFLWANDLSAFDDPIKFGFHIPLLGSHLSLFNILAVLTSFLISLHSMNMTPDQNNPMMKYLPYIFPVFLLFFFNRLPSALTWYYTVSNTISLILQIIIQRYIIDHDKILAKIAENRKKPKTKSKWQERLEQMQDQQKKMKDMQQKNTR